MNYTLKNDKNSAFSKYIQLLPPGVTKFKIKVIFGISDLKIIRHEILRKNNLKFDLIPKIFPNRPLCSPMKLTPFNKKKKEKNFKFSAN